MIHFAESVAAGTDKIKTIWAASRNAYIARVDFVASTAISHSADNSNYTTFRVIDPDNGATGINGVNSKLTGGQAFAADTFHTVVKGNDLAASSQGRLHFDRGERLQFQKDDSGTGNAVSYVLVRVQWIPY